MSPGDPTDHALAAIASMLDQPEAHREPETAAVAERPIDREPIEADGYSKTGPGPMAAIRFKWSVRRGENGEYYVDETIGENSAPVVRQRAITTPVFEVLPAAHSAPVGQWVAAERPVSLEIDRLRRGYLLWRSKAH